MSRLTRLSPRLRRRPRTLRRRLLPQLRIQNQITVPYLVLLGLIALIGTPIASNFVSDRIGEQAEGDLQMEVATVQAYFAEKEHDLKSVSQSIALRPDIVGHLERGEPERVIAALIPEKGKHELDFILVLDSGGRVVASDSELLRPDSLEDSTVARFAAYEATYVDLLDVRPALERAPAEGGSATDALDQRPQRPSRFALVAGSPIKTDEVHGHVLAGRYVNAEMLYEAARFAGGFRDDGSGSTPRYFVSLYAADEQGLVATSGDFRPASPQEGSAAAEQARVSPSSRCDTCHANGGPEGHDLSPEAVSGSVQTLEMAGQDYMVVHGNLLISGVPEGVFSILTDRQAVVAAQTAARNGFIMGTLVLVLLVVSIGYAISRTLTRPIVDLSEVTGKIAAGDLTRPVPLYVRGDEIGELSQSIATMTQTLRENTDSLQSRLEEISLLYAFGSAASSTLDLREILQTLLQSAARVLGADSGSIMLVGRSGTDLRLMAGLEDHRLFAMDRRVPISDGVAGWVVRNRRTILLPRDFDRFPELRESARGDSTTSLCVPIESKESVLGVLNLSSRDPEHGFETEAASLSTALANQAAVAIENATLFEAQQELHLRVVRALGAAIDAKDRYTQGHSSLVARYGMALGRELGLSDTDLHDLEIAGYLHDIGKIGIYDEILNKDGRLSGEERQVIQTHPVIGATIIEPIGFSWAIVGAVRHHHEWWNGKGYPDGLRGSQIPLGARILAIVDAFEAMTAVRPYKPALTYDEAWMEISRMAGVQFDPEMVECFLRVLELIDDVHEVARSR